MKYLIKNKRLCLTLLLFFSAAMFILAGDADGMSHIDDFNSDSCEFRFMTYNIRVGKGMDQAKDLERIAAVIIRERPDVVALQEVDSVTSRTCGVDQIRELGRMTGMYGVFAAALEFDGGMYGVGILSLEKPLSVKRVPLPGREEPRVLLIAEFSNFVAMSTHFSLTEEDRVASAEIVNREAMLFDKPLLLGGDFNAEPQSEPVRVLGITFTLLSDDTQPTFPADEPKVCIDYVFAKRSESYSFKVLNSTVIPESIASDHRPVSLSLRGN